ncbi:TPA: hypothetical protein ACGO8M_000152 [Streptococcus suis]
MLRIIEKYRHSFFILNAINLTSVAKSVGFVHQTVRNLLNRYLSGDLEALLKENRGGRRRSYMTHEEEEVFLKEHLSSSLNGEFVTVNSLFKAYQEKVGHKTTREGFYALLKRHGWVKESKDSLRREIKLTQ